MPFFNGNASSEIWIQSSRICRHVEELKSSVNSSGRPITTIGVAGHRAERFQLGVSKDLFPNGVTILARENMQSGLIRIDLEADIAHTHHVLDPSVDRWYDRQWIVERSAWRFGDIDSLVLAFSPSTIDAGARDHGHILIYRFAAVDEQEWKVFSSHDQLLQRFSHMTLDTAVTEKHERFAPTTPHTPVAKKREEKIEQPSLVIAPPRLTDPKPFCARRQESAAGPTPKLEHQLQAQQGEEQARPATQRLARPASPSASDGHQFAAASIRQPTPKLPQDQVVDVPITEVIRRPETPTPRIAPRKTLAARPVDTQAPSAPSGDQADRAFPRPEAPEQPAPSDEAAAAPSIGDETPMALSIDEEHDQHQPTQPTQPEARADPQKTVAERASEKQAPALSRDQGDDDIPVNATIDRRADEASVVDDTSLAPAVERCTEEAIVVDDTSLAPAAERRTDEAIVVDDVPLAPTVDRRTEEAIVVDDTPLAPAVERRTEEAIDVDDIPFASVEQRTDDVIVVDDTPLVSAVERRTDDVIAVDEVDDDEDQPPVARRRRSASRRMAAARRIDGSSPPPFSSDRGDDDAEYRTSMPEYISPPRTTVNQPLLNLDALFLEEPPRRSGRLLERQRSQLEKAHRKKLKEQERIRRAAPRRPQYPLQAHGLLKALWTRPVQSVMMARTWPMRVANNERVMHKLQDHLGCIDDEEDQERGEHHQENRRALENGVASDLWLHLRQIVGTDDDDDDDEEEEAATATPMGLLTQATPQQRSPERRSPAKAAQKSPQRKSSPSITIARLVLPNYGNISFTKLELQQAWLQTIAEERALETLLDKRRKRWEKVYKTCALHKAYMPFL
ncbi:uncharacterized protein PAN0_021d6012 [Moesziomyces antarcticus]|uniref:Uncharacterized protein n=2 Tax=Pseudozyma antarctica TaxID=84753 RepID=A0A5C3FX43_PSEA2|nr:uncharacterized protein PAN0_021d6012 [Moesziomyces antarcticus]GAK67783.1 hypothetical protein PAN0_021d6012 [Moesziomyces antarcticus]SPO48978.1 uncharacterized protein PSANT_06669 [Moesziomyces antarcticus]